MLFSGWGELKTLDGGEAWSWSGEDRVHQVSGVAVGGSSALGILVRRFSGRGEG